MNAGEFILTLFNGGFDTSKNQLSMAMSLLLDRPEPLVEGSEDQGAECHPPGRDVEGGQVSDGAGRAGAGDLSRHPQELRVAERGARLAH